MYLFLVSVCFCLLLIYWYRSGAVTALCRIVPRRNVLQSSSVQHVVVCCHGMASVACVILDIFERQWTHQTKELPSFSKAIFYSKKRRCVHTLYASMSVARVVIRRPMATVTFLAGNEKQKYWTRVLSYADRKTLAIVNWATKEISLGLVTGAHGVLEVYTTQRDIVGETRCSDFFDDVKLLSRQKTPTTIISIIRRSWNGWTSVQMMRERKQTFVSHNRL